LGFVSYGGYLWALRPVDRLFRRGPASDCLPVDEL